MIKSDTEKTKIQITKKEIYFFLLIFSGFTPQILELSNPELEKVINYFRIVSFVIICLIYVINKQKVSKVTLIICVSSLWYIITCVINGISFFSACTSACMQVSVALIVDHFIDNKGTVINVFMFIFEILIYTNFYSLIRYYPNGYMYYKGVNGQKWYFLGLNNNFIKIFLPAIMVSLIKMNTSKRKTRSLILMAICYISVYIEYSATSFFGITILLLSYFIISKFYSIEKTSLKRNTIFFLIIDISVVFMNAIERIPLLGKFITNVINKTKSLTGRLKIWKKAVELIKIKPIIGYGASKRITFTAFKEKIELRDLDPGHCHNQWLQLMLEGGIINLLLFFYLLKVIGDKYKQTSNVGKKIVFSVFSCFFILCITQPYCQEPHMVLIYILAYNIDKLLRLVS